MWFCKIICNLTEMVKCNQSLFDLFGKIVATSILRDTFSGKNWFGCKEMKPFLSMEREKKRQTRSWSHRCASYISSIVNVRIVSVSRSLWCVFFSSLSQVSLAWVSRHHTSICISAFHLCVSYAVFSVPVWFSEEIYQNNRAPIKIKREIFV